MKSIFWISNIALFLYIGCQTNATAADAKSPGISATFRFQDLHRTDNLTPGSNDYVICYDASVATKSETKDGKTVTANVVTLTVNAQKGREISELPCEQWFNTKRITDRGGRLFIVIQTDDQETLEKAFKLGVTVSSQTVASVSDVRPQVSASSVTPSGFAGGTKKSTTYILEWPYKMTSGSATTVSLNVRTLDDKETNAATDWLLPVIPTKYKYAIMPGIVYSTIQTKTYAYASNAISAPYATTELSSTHIIDPVLFLSYYYKGIDPSTKGSMGPQDQAVIFGVSLKSPTSNFYLGYSFEPIRNVSIVTGLTAAKVSRVASDIYDSGPSASHTAPPTKDEFKFGGFIGVAFNFSTFLQQSLFAGK